MSQFLAWLDDAEPLTAAQVARQGRLDPDVAADSSDYITTVIIPAARQAAESRAGSAIRKARYRDTLERIPAVVTLDMGQAYQVESVAIADTVLDSAAYELVSGVGEPRLRPTGADWGAQGRMVVEYQAGIDIANYPSVLQWMLLAAGWMLEQPSMFSLADAVQAMPQGYLDNLLAPISVVPRF